MKTCEDVKCDVNVRIKIKKPGLFKVWLFGVDLTISRVVNLGTTTKLCLRNFVPKPHPGHVVVVSRPKIGLRKVGVTVIFVLFYN